MGEAFGTSMPVHTVIPVCYFDVDLEPGAEIDLPVPRGFNVFCHVISGRPSIAGSEEQGRMYETFFFNRDGNSVRLSNESEEHARVIVVGGDPMEGHEVVRYGPFVSTSKEGIEKAFSDYRKVSQF